MPNRWLQTCACAVLAVALVAGGCTERSSPAADSATPPSPARPTIALATTAPAAPRVWAASHEEYGVYVAVLQHLLMMERHQTNQRVQFVLSARTFDRRVLQGDPAVPEHEDKIIEEVDLPRMFQAESVAGLMAEFSKANERPAQLDARRLAMDGADVNVFPQQDYYGVDAFTWSASARYPRARRLLMFSRVGFQGEWALVRMDIRAEPQNGAGTAYLLRREGRGWRIVEERLAWIS